MSSLRYKRLIAIILCIGMLIPYSNTINKVYASTTQTGTITASSLNVRKGAGTSYDKVQVNGVYAYLTKGQTVTITKEVDGWYYIKFTFNGVSTKGYVLGDYVDVNKSSSSTTDQTTSATTNSSANVEIPAKVTATVLNLRSKASTSGTVLEKLSKSAKVTILKEKVTSSGKWYQIEVDKTGTVGYALSTYVKIQFDENVKALINSSTKVKVRKTASKNGSYVKSEENETISLKNAKAVTILSEKTVDETKWFQISFKYNSVTYKGYVLAGVVKFKEMAVTATPTPTATPTSTPTPSPTPDDSTEQGEVTLTPTPTPTKEPETNSYSFEAGVLTNNINITMYRQPGFSNQIITDNSGALVYINANTPFAIYDQDSADGFEWYYVGVQWNSKVYYGYILKDLVIVDNSYQALVQGFGEPDKSQNNSSSGNNSSNGSNNSGSVTTNEAFETKLANQGFPESYKVLLRKLHESYPNWEFEAYHTGLDWSTAVAKESAVGLNLITNTRAFEWKSLESGAYNWKTDKFIVFDGSTWVTASKDAVAYYMDPRNFLTEKGVFQFELLSYRSSYQNQAGVENILKSTPLYNKSFTYVNESGNTVSCTYAEAFIAAAEYSNVSPYHLATRVKQEVVTGTSSVSDSVSGTVSGYEGLYNFYNIGAYHSTAAGGAIANALEYALNGSGSAKLDMLYRIPWDNPYDALLGGAYLIGSTYINRGDATYHSQDTIYLQKFNVTNKTTYAHQYMANVEAAYAEAKKMYSAYSSLDLPIVFSIPVYENMPEEVVQTPATAYNPNNWLSSLSVTDASGKVLSLTPTFDLSLDQDYYLIVDSNVDIVNITGTTVSSKASIIAGVGTLGLDIGTNVITVLVKAENGDIRSYNIYIVRS